MVKFPFSEKQIEYIQRANRRWNIKSGATRSGKSYVDTHYMIPYRLMEKQGKDGLNIILGVTKETIERNVLLPMRNFYGTDSVSEINSRNKAILFGQEVYCLGAEKANQVSKIRGSSIKYCYGDEVADWAREVFDLLKSRLDKPYSQFDGSLNPKYPTHWLKKFIDKMQAEKGNIYVQHYVIDDNPFIDSRVVEEMKREYLGTVYYDRYILGKWVLANGLVYPDFSKTIKIQEKANSYSNYWVSIDYGIMNAVVFQLFGKVAGINEFHMLKEYYYSGRETGRALDDEIYCHELQKFVDGLKIDYFIIDPSASSLISMIRRRRLGKIKKANNEVIGGIQKVITTARRGEIKVHESCVRTLQEFDMYSWSEREDAEIPVKKDDHAMDSLRYFVNSVVSSSRSALNI